MGLLGRLQFGSGRQETQSVSLNSSLFLPPWHGLETRACPAASLVYPINCVASLFINQSSTCHSSLFVSLIFTTRVVPAAADGTQLQMVKVGCRGLAVVRVEPPPGAPPVPVTAIVGQVLDKIESGELKRTK